MDRYFYLISQLPMLFFDREPLVTISDFLEETEKWFSRKEAQALARVNLHRLTMDALDNTTLRQYIRYESRLRADVAAWRRAQKNDQEYKPETFSPSLLKEGNPLEIEKKLLELRWKFLDDMESEHHFDFGRLVIYYLKLQILHRLMTFNKEEGMEKFKSYEVNL